MRTNNIATGPPYYCHNLIFLWLKHLGNFYDAIVFDVNDGNGLTRYSSRLFTSASQEI